MKLNVQQRHLKFLYFKLRVKFYFSTYRELNKIKDTVLFHLSTYGALEIMKYTTQYRKIFHKQLWKPNPLQINNKKVIAICLTVSKLSLYRAGSNIRTHPTGTGTTYSSMYSYIIWINQNKLLVLIFVWFYI